MRESLRRASKAIAVPLKEGLWRWGWIWRPRVRMDAGAKKEDEDAAESDVDATRKVFWPVKTREHQSTSQG